MVPKVEHDACADVLIVIAAIATSKYFIFGPFMWAKAPG